MVERVAKSFDLQFWDGRHWRPIPVWAKFFISLGAALSTAHLSNRRIVAALSVPTPSFAAAFVALGRILSEPISEPAKTAVDAHFDKLAVLPTQTPLIYFDGAALYNGPFMSTVKHSGDDFIRMTIRSGACMIPKARCLLVDVQPESQTGKRVRLKNPKHFVGRFFSLVEHYRILCSTKKSVIIIGEKNRLRSELVRNRFAIPDGTDYVEGVLQDLIRIGKFSSGGVGCRADVYARSKGHAIQNCGSGTESSLIVLDGAASHFRWAHEYLHCDSLSILSRTEPEYGSAIDSANARYLTRLDDYTLPGLIGPPPGIELMVHLEDGR